MHNTQIINRLDSILAFGKHNQGSYGKLSYLLSQFPQKSGAKIVYIVAGSWAIEFISGQKMAHDDIDLIALANPLTYTDDATTKEEKAHGVIPIPLSYFAKSGRIAVCKNTRGSGKVYTPNLNLQLCFKLIGELDSTLSKRAANQLHALLSCYKNFDKTKTTSEIFYILKQTCPEDIDPKSIAKDIVSSIELNRTGKRKEAANNLRKIHGTINSSLHKEFRHLGIE